MLQRKADTLVNIEQQNREKLKAYSEWASRIIDAVNGLYLRHIFNRFGQKYHFKKTKETIQILVHRMCLRQDPTPLPLGDEQELIDFCVELQKNMLFRHVAAVIIMFDLYSGMLRGETVNEQHMKQANKLAHDFRDFAPVMKRIHPHKATPDDVTAVAEYVIKIINEASNRIST